MCDSSKNTPEQLPVTNNACGHSPVVPADANADEFTTCPVMVGSPVNKAVAVEQGLFRDYEGERYYFCCAGCGPAFDADPAKYAKAA